MTTVLRVTPETEAQVEQAAAWWRENRPAAPDLFSQELAGAFDLLARAPQVGRRYLRRSIPGLRRLLLPSTRYHVYYVHAAGSDTCVILAVWSAVRGRGPRLSAP
jgi:plasmid stabilization system protein ParE